MLAWGGQSDGDRKGCAVEAPAQTLDPWRQLWVRGAVLVLGCGKPGHGRQYAPKGIHAPMDLIETQFDDVENEPFRSASTKSGFEC
jgi:hypothetical protein